ncbi:MAG: hypothetical protein R3C99_11165 [Pirellulaceae bacterium]
MFAKYPTASDLASSACRNRSWRRKSKSTGFFRNKAKNIKACCQALVDQYDGQVPPDLDALVELAGVGRKTANVVMGTAFGEPTGVRWSTPMLAESRGDWDWD